MAKSVRSNLLEDGFFLAEEAKQLKRMRTELRDKDRKQALRECSGIDDEDVINHLAELDIAPETMSAMTLVPLVAVAWADGKLDDREVQAVLDGAEQKGIKVGTAAHGLLNSWLTHAPGDNLVDVWARYVDELLDQLTPAERQTMHECVMGRARGVAEAAGGFLGLKTISSAEEAMLDRLDNAFHAS